MAAQKRKINLLPKDEFEQSAAGRLLKWSLTVGRYIVIGTELVVIGAFLARFSLDRQVTDLNEQIAQKQAVIKSYGDLERGARAIQKRLELIKNLSAQQLDTAAFFDRAESFTPVDVIYSSISVSAKEINLRGTAFSEAGLQTLLTILREDIHFAQVNVKRVTSQGDEGVGIEFEIQLALASAIQAPGQRSAAPGESSEGGDSDGL